MPDDAPMAGDGPLHDVEAQVRSLLAEHGRLAGDAHALPSRADLYDAGLSSLASVNLMLALEERFDVEFPEPMLRRQTFSSVAAICNAVGALRSPGSAG